jgi:hypothetical protein
MSKRRLLIEKYKSLIEINDIENELIGLKKKLNNLKDRHKYLKDRVCDINYELKHINQLNKVLEPIYK